MHRTAPQDGSLCGSTITREVPRGEVPVPPGYVRTCNSCGTAFTEYGWSQLVCVGIQRTDAEDDEPFELRICPIPTCHNGIARLLPVATAATAATADTDSSPRGDP